MRYGSTLSDVARVLLVDDNEEMLARSAATLAPACEIIGAVKDGPAALQAAEALHPDVIVLDISMPGMSGVDVLRAMRAQAGHRPSPPIVMFSADENQAILDEAMRLGAIGFVSKTNPDALLRVVEAHVRPTIPPHA